MKKKGCLFLLFFILAHSQTFAQINFTCPLNTQQSIQNGAATVNSSTLDIGSIASIFDGNDATLARSANINPLVVTISFTNTVNLTSIRVIQSYGEGWFTLEAADVLSDLNNQVGTYQKLLNQIATINGVPIGGAINMSVTASKKIYRLTVKKTVGDNFVHLNEWGLVGTVAYNAESLTTNSSGITMYPTWKTYLTKTGWYQVPQVFAVIGGNNILVNTSCISWTVANNALAEVTEGVLIAKAAGNTFLIGNIGSGSVQIPLTVKAPVLQPEKEVNIDNFLKTPAACFATLVPVLIIVHLPTKDGINFDDSEIPGYTNQLLSKVKNDALKIFIHTKFSLEEGSKYKGYSNPSANPFLGYKVVDYLYIYEPLPLSIPDNPTQGSFWIDYYQIVERNLGKHYVETMGVKEIWLMGYHTNKVTPIESNMASKTTGNISNSYRREDDLPKYDKTYIFYTSNITRGGNESTHNHGHQIEAMCDWVAYKQDAGNTQLFNRDFRGYTITGQGPLNRVGDTHHPPNSRSDYDYENNTLVASDIFDWKPAGGTQTMVNYLTWANIPYAWPAGISNTPESNWYILWMQSLPGNGNKIPYGSKWMTNWWRFMSDWDSTTIKIGLYQNTIETTQTSCFPTAVIDVANNEHLKLFPNPVQNHFVILRSNNNRSSIQIKIFDITGKILKLLNSNLLRTEVDLSHFSSGNYVIWIEDKERNLISRRIITKL